MLHSKNTLFTNLLLQVFGLINCLLDPLEIWRLWQINPLITSRTMSKGESDSICIRVSWLGSCSSKIKVLLLIPSLLNLALKTIKMKNVFASKLNYWFFSKSLDIADHTEWISIFSKSFIFIFCNTFFVQTRWMNLLMSTTVARMSTRLQKLLTALPWLSGTLSFRAEIFPCIFKYSLAKSAFFSILCFFILRTILA